MAAANFAINVIMTFPPGATQTGQAQSFQLVAPWGASDVCSTWKEALTQLYSGKGGNFETGRMGAYFNFGTLNNASGTGSTAFLTANNWNS